MKKLNLKLDGKQMLSKEQMKTISGGYQCGVYCLDGGTLLGVYWLDHNEGCYEDPVIYCTVLGQLEGSIMQYTTAAFCQC